MGGASAGSHVNEVHDRLEPGPKPTGGWGAERPPPQETIRRKILLSCRNFCDLNN